MNFFKQGTEENLSVEDKKNFLSFVANGDSREKALFKVKNITYALSCELSENMLSLIDWYQDSMILSPEDKIQRIIFFDTETTHINGLAVSLAMILTDLEGNILETYYEEINPLIKNDPESFKVHKLSDEHLATCQTFEDLESSITSFLNKGDLLVAHNISYDIGVLIREYERLGKDFPSILSMKLDTMTSIKNMIEFKGIKKKNPKLSEVAIMLNFDLNNITLHNALDDTKLMLEIYKAIINNPEVKLILTEEIVNLCKKDKT